MEEARMGEHEGRVSRRVALAGFGTIGLGALLAACGQGGGGPAPVTTSTGATATISPQATRTGDAAGLFDGSNTCVLTPEATPGPYHFDADKIRSDIREDRPGVLLRVAIRVQDSETCRPVPDAVVEIWHCDAVGVYSGFEAQSVEAGGGGGGGSAPAGGSGADAAATPADRERFLRGAQVTDSEGVVQFTTVYPGWYRGRAVHIHAMVHLGDTRVLTTQVMFPEDVNEAVFTGEPYSGRGGPDVRNTDDSIFEDAMLLKMTKQQDGYLGVITFAIDSDRERR